MHMCCYHFEYFPIQIIYKCYGTFIPNVIVLFYFYRFSLLSEGTKFWSVNKMFSKGLVSLLVLAAVFCTIQTVTAGTSSIPSAQSENQKTVIFPMDWFIRGKRNAHNLYLQWQKSSFLWIFRSLPKKVPSIWVWRFHRN